MWSSVGTVPAEYKFSRNEHQSVIKARTDDEKDHILETLCEKKSLLLQTCTPTGSIRCETLLLKHPASEDELKLFHSAAYIDVLKSLESFDLNLDEHVEYGLGYDCPVLDNLHQLAECVAGGTLSAAKLLVSRKCKTAINWFGGWHHARRDSASGFCYINDIAIGIQFMSTTFERILYIDLDVHHGMDIFNAFENSNKILTLSFHKHEVGFFSNSGNLDEAGIGKGKNYSLNVPYQGGISDETPKKM
uniref:Histone deacetylase 8 n=1 Tax=Dendroctonus ponderosae TaxID=77166 RepID=A0AAR5Q1W6_DENPD